MTVQDHLDYARAALFDCLCRGEAPIASHLLLTQPGVLNDLDPVERARGIEAGLAWIAVADAVVVYTDLGLSSGMMEGIKRAVQYKKDIEYRRINGPWTVPREPAPVLD